MQKYICEGNPYQKMEYYRMELLNTNEERTWIDRILLVLYIADKEIRKLADSTQYYYIQDTKSIRWLLNKSSCEIEEKLFERVMLVLDWSKLLYKFTCAQKFKIEDQTIEQIRINSWGRAYVENNKLLSLEEEFCRNVEDTLRAYLNENRKEYMQLLCLLRVNKRILRVDNIKKINGKVEFKVLA